MKEYFISSDNPDLREFQTAEGFQSRSAAMTWNSAKY
jgi:hypothetical protein